MMEKIELYAGRLAAQRHLVALRNGIVLGMPLIIIGSLFLILGNLPSEAYMNWIQDIGIAQYFSKITNGSFGLMGLIAVFGIAHSLARHYGKDGVSAGAIALSAFVIVTPDLVTDVGTGIDYTYVGSAGLFIAIVVGLLTAEIFSFAVDQDWTIKMPEGVPPAVARSFSALIPGFLVILLAGLVYAIMDMTGVADGNIHVLVTETIGRPFTAVGSSLWGSLLMIFLNSFFWFLGIHGNNIIGPIMQPVWLANSDQNRLAFEAGEALPNIITNEFMTIFVWMGGGGSTLALAICLAFFSKSEQAKALGALTLPSGIFNINEPLIFGLPIVLNFKLLIPFILAPMVIAVITYFAMSLGLVALPAGIVVPWTMPAIIAGYLATGGAISGAVIQAITLVVSIAVYYPFMRSWDKENIAREEEEARTEREAAEAAARN
ncbi:MAG TPA: PTS cellobiose transporter subunit IIC [Atopostipes sp.]|nr:PTS cellobiose transporter subunit IIC [Atopostipes sp.]